MVRLQRFGQPRGTAAMLAFAAFVLLAVAAPASAHAEVETSDPAQGARLSVAPLRVVVHLSEPIEPSATSMTVVDATGARVDLGDLRIEGGNKPILTLSLREDLGPGAYAIVWKTLSRYDGHPSGDRIGFAVGDFEPPTGASPDAWPPLAAVAGRALAFTGLALAFGAAAWLWFVRADLPASRLAAQRALAGGAALHSVGLLLLLKATADQTGLDAAALADSQVGRLLGFRLVVGLGALALAALVLVPGNPSRLGAPLAAALMVAAGLGSSAIGHAASHGLPGMAVDAMHLFASATWVGGLVLLLVYLVQASRAGVALETVRRTGLRFGTLALVCVLVLFLAGLATSLIILGQAALLDPLHLTESLYGRLLLAKVVLALLMVALAAANRFVFLDPSTTRGVAGRLAARVGPDGTGAGLRRAVAAEASIGALILVLAAMLTAVSPSLQDDGGGAVDAYADGARFHYHLMVDPAPVAGGRSTLVLAIVDLSSGEMLVDNTCGRDSCVQLAIAPEGAAEEDMRLVLAPDGEGHWRATDVLWTFSGPVLATVQVQTAVAEDSAQLTFTVG